MRFKDLLVADLGELPPEAYINEDLYDLLTLPYSLGTDMHARISIATYHGDDSRYQIGMALTKGLMDMKLVTDIHITDGNAEITQYNGEASIPRSSGPQMVHGHATLKFTDKDYDGCKEPFQNYLADLSSTALWMNGIANNKNISVNISDENASKEHFGILYHMIHHMGIEPIPREVPYMEPERIKIKLGGDGDRLVTILRPEAKVDGERLEERFDAIYKPDTGTLEIQREARPRDEKTLRRLVTEGKPLVTHASKSIRIDSEMTAMNYAIGVRNLMKQLQESPASADELLDGLTQDGLEL